MKVDVERWATFSVPAEKGPKTGETAIAYSANYTHPTFMSCICAESLFHKLHVHMHNIAFNSSVRKLCVVNARQLCKHNIKQHKATTYSICGEEKITLAYAYEGTLPFYKVSKLVSFWLVSYSGLTSACPTHAPYSITIHTPANTLPSGKKTSSTIQHIINH